ncbi:glucan endo-1,3-beta-glucosidase 7-like [Durio zibethinus]|uniref:glucan endo-1,3-beta-D-glucosidase n=1 Tax=Durio zibethinus TaxID=66656 RepID=A0A6P5X9I8_DURZI|nr:glucan endo-1,3-beta-glucosidase 7-like [Durio zibethinus]
MVHGPVQTCAPPNQHQVSSLLNLFVFEHLGMGWNLTLTITSLVQWEISFQKRGEAARNAILRCWLKFCTGSEPFIGVNYGQVADNLPPPSATAKLLQSTLIEKVRLYGADPAIITALANTGIGIVIGAGNGDIPTLASDPNSAAQWVNSNVLPFYPASNIILITVGNEVLTTNDPNLINQLLPALQNVQNALNAASLGGKIKVSTVHSMAVLYQSDPPSSGLFIPSYQPALNGLLQFQKDNGSPFAINPYPFFAYQSDPIPETLAFCLFQPNAGRVDSGNGIKYMNMFDAQVDAVHSALSAMGFKDVEIMVAETGWPYSGDSNEVGPSIENAKAYNGNLIAHLRSMVGTPLMPGKSVDTYLFALYDEDLKPGPGSERAFGLFRSDLSMIYDVGISKSDQTPSSPQNPVTPQPIPTANCWCVTVSSSGKASGSYGLNVSIKPITNGSLTIVARLGDIQVNPSFVLKNVHQNGVTERKNSHLLVTTRAFLFQANS